MPRPRAAIVGAGLMGKWHAAYAARAGVEVAAVVDLDEGAAEGLCRRFAGALPFGALEDCLARRPVEAVHVCTGLESHAALVESALRAGKHVLVEKPAVPQAAEVRRLGRIAQDARLTFCAVHQMPFQRGFVGLRGGLARLGTLVRVGYEAASAGGSGRSAADRRALLLEMLPHPVSLFRGLLGGGLETALAVQAFTDDDLELAGSRGDTRLAVAISLRARPTRHELVVTGTDGTAQVDLFHGYAVLDRAGTSRTSKMLSPFRRGARLLGASATNLAGRALRREPAYPGLRPLIEAFYASTGGQGPPPVSLEEMVEAAALMERVSLASRVSSE